MFLDNFKLLKNRVGRLENDEFFVRAISGQPF
jgi:hypothetical protein